MQQLARGHAVSDPAPCLGACAVARRPFQLIDRPTTNRRRFRTNTARLLAWGPRASRANPEWSSQSPHAIEGSLLSVPAWQLVPFVWSFSVTAPFEPTILNNDYAYGESQSANNN